MFFRPMAEKSAWGPYQTEMVCNGPLRHVGYRKAADAGTEFPQNEQVTARGVHPENRWH